MYKYLLILIITVSAVRAQAPDKTIGAHWWGTRSISYDENPIRLKVGQNLTITFDDPGPGSYFAYPYHVKYTIYGQSIAGSNQNPFDFTRINHSP